MIRELQSMTALFREVDAVRTTISHDLWTRLGSADEMIQREFEAINARAREANDAVQHTPQQTTDLLGVRFAHAVSLRCSSSLTLCPKIP
jgi:uncharacterized alpha-E superfamily protein